MRERSSFRQWIARPEVIISLVAIVIGVCSLFVAVYETSLVRRGQVASVWPYVEVAPSFGRGQTALFVANSGVGPARIEAASLYHGGERLASWTQLISAVTGEEATFDGYQSLVNGRVLPAASSETIFGVEGESPDAVAFMAAFREQVFAGTIDVSVCYCSVYDECWVASMQEVVARSRGELVSRESRRVRHCRDAAVSGI